MDEMHGNLLTRLSWTALALASAHVLIAAVMAVAGNPAGLAGGVFYALAYALPLVLVAAALRANASAWVKIAGWAALGIATFETAIVVGNWSGYSATQAVFVTAISAPTVALYLAVFWATILRGAHGEAARTPSRGHRSAG